LGGLIDRRNVTTDSGVPGLSRIPILGYLFTDKVETEETRELVIILSVSLV
jgi:type II secretory pathway component GspD/PulD (secretin)